ncbi:hypothetical protein BDF19DRAFT_426012 [Syncephalis fuscata]|nr:hypothetical protein BDF19DRAFT_426012 [Syncephalis fuscata]
MSTNSMDLLGSSHSMSGYPMLIAKTELRIAGNLDAMLYEWSMEERQERRRLVEFAPQRSNNTITCSFQPVTPGDHKPPHIVVSCIFWEDRGDCFITSVDCIHLLESLMVIPPITVSKAKPETAEFFKLIMSFPIQSHVTLKKMLKYFHGVLYHTLYAKSLTNISSSIDMNLMQRGGNGGLMLSSPMTSSLTNQGHGTATDRQHRYGSLSNGSTGGSASDTLNPAAAYPSDPLSSGSLGSDAATFDLDSVSSQQAGGTSTANDNTNGGMLNWPASFDGLDTTTFALSPRTQQQLRQAGLSGRRHSIADPYSLRQASQQLFDLAAANNSLNTSLAGLSDAARIAHLDGRDAKQDFIDFSAPPPAGLNVFP